MASKSSLAIELSKLRVFSAAKVNLEQYPTDSEIAATVLWDAFMHGEIKDKIIADLGCGTGILGIGALLLEAKFVYFVDIDKEALEILKENIARLGIPIRRYRIVRKDVEEVNKEYHVQIKTDTVIQNPPFGTKDKHIDKLFLEKAFSVGNIIYSFHKITSKKFISELAKDHGFNQELIHKFDFPLKASMKHHKKKTENIEVGCWKLSK
ncbi:MAG: METTL5 family protein [Candidatus Woesearchaeota archaeon]